MVPGVDFRRNEVMVRDHDYTSLEGLIQLEDDNYNINNVKFSDSQFEGLSYIGRYLCRELG